MPIRVTSQLSVEFFGSLIYLQLLRRTVSEVANKIYRLLGKKVPYLDKLTRKLSMVNSFSLLSAIIVRHCCLPLGNWKVGNHTKIITWGTPAEVIIQPTYVNERIEIEGEVKY